MVIGCLGDIVFQVSEETLKTIREMEWSGSAHYAVHQRHNGNAVLQNIALILATPKGSVPFYRDFGISTEFLDKPMPVAKAMMIGEVREAVETWEPRATVVDIRFAESPLEPGRLIPTVEVEISVEESGLTNSDILV